LVEELAEQQIIASDYNSSSFLCFFTVSKLKEASFKIFEAAV